MGPLEPIERNNRSFWSEDTTRLVEISVLLYYHTVNDLLVKIHGRAAFEEIPAAFNIGSITTGIALIQDIQLDIKCNKSMSIVNILAVIVLYRCCPEDSATINTLRPLLGPFADRIRVLVYDNSPQPSKKRVDSGWNYLHDPSNGGLAAAYNTAFHVAQQSAEWLLLLDQDSLLSKNFLEELFFSINRCDQDSRIAAIVPRIYSENMMISPSRVKLGRCIEESGSGLRSHEIAALNSGSLIRVSFLAEIGGFNPLFWLDFLDYWLYHEIHAHGYHVFVSRASMIHNLSLLGKDYVSYERYDNILTAETRFINIYRPRHEQIIYPIRLVLRSIEQILTSHKRHVAGLTWKAIFRQFKFLVNGSNP